MTEPINNPKSAWELYWSFTLMAMQAFGGSTAIAQQFLVDQKRWLTQQQFLELLTVAQVIPGPNIMNLTIMFGDRHFAWKGALAAFLGMTSVPMTLMLSVFVIYKQYAEIPIVSAALTGMAASAAGMVFGAAIRLLPDIKSNAVGQPAWVLLLLLTFALVGWFKLSMVYVLPLIGIPACFWAYYRIITDKCKEHGL